MPIISTIGRKKPSQRALIIAIYFILITGGITMLYPFMLMISTAVTSEVDFNDHSIIPRYFFDDHVRFKKFLERKYVTIQIYNDVYGTDYFQIKEIEAKPKVLTEGEKKQVADWYEFKKHVPLEFTKTGFRSGELVTPVVNKLYVEYLKKKFGNDIDKLNKVYNEENVLFSRVLAPFEDPLIKVWKFDDSPKTKDWIEFKKTLSPGFLLVLSSHHKYNQVIKGKYAKINKLNKAWKTSFKSFSDIKLPISLPKDNVQASDWKEFIRNRYPPRFFKKDKKGKVNIYNPERLYSDFLKGEIANIEELNKKYGTDYKRFSNVQLPLLLEDSFEYNKNKKNLFLSYLTFNFEEVSNYILLHGRALWVTFLLVAGTILCQLTINPLCAYALSRFRLPFAYNILLFFLATMAFPAEVKMIPNFLLLRDLHLLNTIWALILPHMANGFQIFLLKGFFDSLPKELFEAAEMEGAGELMMFWKVALPLSRPVFAVLALWTFTYTYGSFMWAFVVCQDSNWWTLMVYLYEFQQAAPPYMQMAAFAIATIPTFVVFLFAQRIILRGIVLPTFH